MGRKILRQPDVLDKVGVKASTLKNLVKKGLFPAPLKLGEGRAIGWADDEVEDWIDKRIAKRDKEAA